jgi:DHA1 family bicyclomycin/chloramphenicol resistance-like MFS transporter
MTGEQEDLADRRGEDGDHHEDQEDQRHDIAQGEAGVPVAHGALAIFTVSGLLLFGLALGGNPPFWVTFGLLSICMMAFGVLQGNMSAIALEPMGHIAGTASSLVGVVTMTIANILAGVVGQAYDGTVIPLAFAFGFSGLAAAIAIFWTERGRVFRNTAPATGHSASSTFH